ncbi:hypothetical protein NDU88_002440 [Pleurodeles waltl]|uniref:Uncharacterized protein n=1 Tax=Pleurodeles waltl TaxID=8319 RepID=A0AAV7U9S3_PLEWA|nr:hypothetical protein NDU88_002440 [Pleurodeles waltl]
MVAMRESGPLVDPSLGVVLSAIQDLRGCLEPKLDAVTVDVTLFRADFKKVTEKVTTKESDFGHLQATSKRLEDQVQFLNKEYENVTARLEDQEGRARRNNIRVVRVPEEAEGQSVELFL